MCSNVSRGHHAKQHTAATDRQTRKNGQILGWQKRSVTHLQGSHQSICWLRPKRARHFLSKPGPECNQQAGTQNRKEQKEDWKKGRGRRHGQSPFLTHRNAKNIYILLEQKIREKKKTCKEKFPFKTGYFILHTVDVFCVLGQEI